VFRADKARDFRSVVLSVPCKTAIERERERERERENQALSCTEHEDDRKLMHVDKSHVSRNPMCKLRTPYLGM